MDFPLKKNHCLSVFLSVCLSVCPSVCLCLSVCLSLSYLFHYVPIMVWLWNFQEWLPMTELISVQKIKVRSKKNKCSLISHMVMKWCTKLDIVYEWCPIDFQGHLSIFKVTRLEKIVDFDPNWAFEITDGYEMMHKDWRSIEEVPYCFSRLSVKFQGHRAKKNIDFDPKFGFFGL